MNRAPVALFALLCTLASSMVAAGVANDHQSNPIKLVPLAAKSDLKMVSFAGSSQEQWLTAPSWKSIDIQRAIAMPSKKLPTVQPAAKAAEPNQRVSAIIITIQQSQAPAAKVAEKEPKSALTAAKTVAAPKLVTKPAVKPVVASATPVVLRAPLADVSAAVSQAKQFFAKIPAPAKIAQTKPAAVQARVTSRVSVPYVSLFDYDNAAKSRLITLADLHRYVPMTKINTGLSFAGKAQPAIARPTKIILNGEKLKFDVKSIQGTSIAGTTFIASPYIATDATSILLPKAPSMSKPKAATMAPIKAASVPTARKTVQRNTSQWIAARVAEIQASIARVYDNAVAQLTVRMNDTASFYFTEIRSISTAWTIAGRSTHHSSTIKSAQIKSANNSAVKK